MSTFADFAYYKEHGGKLGEADYAASADDAYAEYLSQTNGAAKTAPEAMLDAVKLCECALVDSIAAFKESSEMLPKGAASVSNDGFTVSAGVVSGRTPQEAEALERHAICARWLQWPVNLMDRWL